MCTVTAQVSPSQGVMSTGGAATQTSGDCISSVIMALGKCLLMPRVAWTCYIYIQHRSLFMLNETSLGWQRTGVCMGDAATCTGDLVGQDRERFVLSFGEDEDGELYVLTTSNPSPTQPAGVVYHIVDPARYVYMSQYSVCSFHSSYISAYLLQKGESKSMQDLEIILSH